MPRGDIVNGEPSINENDLSDDNAAERESLDGRISKLSKLISRLFYAYAAIITLLRLSGYGRLAMGLVEGIIYRFQMTGPRTDFPFNLLPLRISLYSMPLTTGGYLFALLPAVIALYSLKTHFNERSRRLVAGFSLLAVINHAILLAAFIVSWVWVFLMAPGTLYSAPAIMVLLIAFLLFLYKLSGKLKTLKIQAGEVSEYDDRLTVPNLLVAIIFILSPFLGTPPGVMLSNVSSTLGIFSDIRVIATEDCRRLASGANVFSMRVSPDGKLIAMGGENDLSVWNVESKELLFNDTTISARSVRFSDSGKYLAAVGSPTSKDILNSCVALYEVDGFKRVQEVALPADTRHGRNTKVVDVAFRTDEKSIIYVYYSYSDHRQLILVDPESHSPVYHEIEIPSGKRTAMKFFPDLQLSERGIRFCRFTDDGIILSFIRYSRKGKMLHQSFTFYNTTTWEAKTLSLDIPNREVILFITSNNFLLENSSDNFGSGKIYFTHKSQGFSLYFQRNKRYIFSELDIDTEKQCDIIDLEATKVKNTVLRNIVLSPDGTKIAIVGFGEKMPFAFYILVYDLKNRNYEILKFRYERSLHALLPINMAWLNDNKLAFVTSGTPIPEVDDESHPDGWWKTYFFYIDLHDKEEEG
jgi:WD40 repeat protein